MRSTAAAAAAATTAAIISFYPISVKMFRRVTTNAR